MSTVPNREEFSKENGPWLHGFTVRDAWTQRFRAPALSMICVRTSPEGVPCAPRYHNVLSWSNTRISTYIPSTPSRQTYRGKSQNATHVRSKTLLQMAVSAGRQRQMDAAVLSNCWFTMLIVGAIVQIEAGVLVFTLAPLIPQRHCLSCTCQNAGSHDHDLASGVHFCGWQACSPRVLPWVLRERPIWCPRHAARSLPAFMDAVEY